MADDPLATLYYEHQDAKEKLNLLEQAATQAASGSPAGVEQATPTLRQLVNFLDGELRGHFRREEEALFPVLEKHIGREGGPIAVMLIEHRELWRLVDELKERTQRLEAGEASSAPTAARAAKSVVDLLRNHILKEDNILFPLARDTLGDEGIAEVVHRCEVLGLT